eukprot:8907738-Alexandrium_andersonii.AAC.1
MPASSASPELSAIVFCVVDQCLMACTPRTQTFPHVGRQVRRRPAKSVSTNVRTPAPRPAKGN